MGGAYFGSGVTATFMTDFKIETNNKVFSALTLKSQILGFILGFSQ